MERGRYLGTPRRHCNDAQRAGSLPRAAESPFTAPIMRCSTDHARVQRTGSMDFRWMPDGCVRTIDEPFGPALRVKRAPAHSSATIAFAAGSSFRPMHAVVGNVAVG